MSNERKDRDPKVWADHEDHEDQEHQAVDKETEAFAECYRYLIDAGLLKPPSGNGGPA